jgi:1-acyl-sn-glycerol-3-phosphate acyltransferase
MTWPGIWKLNFYDNRHNKKWNKQYVIVSNHLSMIDSIVLIYHIPLKIKFMIAAVFTKIPIFGRLILASGHITADLHDPSLNQTAVDRAIHTIQKDHCSFALFPEGRRELVSYKFERFKTGAYRIAKATNLPILPVTLHGAEKAMGFGGLVNSATITIWIDNPFNVLSDNYQKYIDYTKSIMEKNLSNYNK